MLIRAGRQQRHITMMAGPVPGLAQYLAEHGVAPVPSGLTIGKPTRLTKLAHPMRDEMVARYEAATEAATNERANVDDVVTQAARFISAVLVPGHWMDHSDPAHMRDAVSAGLFEARPVHTMHDADPAKWSGLILESHWDDAKLGKDQAPGVSGIVGIDSKLPHSAALARGVSLGSLTRLSLGFLVDFEPSHAAMADWGFEDFWFKLGTVSKEDGEIFRFIVTSIPDVFEISFVDVGAIESARTDPQAHRAPRSEGAMAPSVKVAKPAARRSLTAGIRAHKG